MTPQEAQARLAVQRTKRPVSPHLTIYKWRYTSLASILNRITGGILAGGLYGFAFVYLLSPMVDLDVSSTAMAEAFGSLPSGTKVFIKFSVALPFAYHCFNGMKHLIWDRGYLLRNKQSQYAAWVVAAAAISTSLGLALWKGESISASTEKAESAI
ncbi:succinate dehydrogenase cytochrome b560 subunit [Paecilomyces variotii No. 5]|uniref:Succinate dehydrogenase cytochrome b560 subunit n=1 Tax=Byssochlamys spectabilis (strain No. 5 / NBRC 109023) TaxID=1356009 RepID=V5FWP6_BYSSN|nr:succinate dehydrogenase cytochrome b560 subunit [Paecilomyces variotii No. 5]